MPIGFNHNTHSVNPSEDSVIEIGTIYGSARSSVPTGYLLCDGSAISRTVYANLFSAIGTSFGIGDGSATFNIPDGRGGVLRGAGTSSGYTQNISVTLGTKNNDTFGSHNHGGGSHSHGIGQGTQGNFTGLVGGHGGTYYGSTTSTDASGTIISNQGSTETQMKNIGVNFFIKF